MFYCMVLCCCYCFSLYDLLLCFATWFFVVVIGVLYAIRCYVLLHGSLLWLLVFFMWFVVIFHCIGSVLWFVFLQDLCFTVRFFATVSLFM